MAEIGSSEWWGAESDKLINFGLNALSTKLLTGRTTPNQQSEATTSPASSGMSRTVPYIILGVVAIGIVVILAKR